jgi:DNA phosphorothioation-associated putative methyltransferase
MTTGVARHLTALKRKELSRPIRLALESSVLKPNFTFLDYGCGQGDDVRFLRELGFSTAGWDPFFSPATPLNHADIVNLGYVINVVEDHVERETTLNKAWSFCAKVLIVAARLTAEHDNEHDTGFQDGYLTRRSTFQKLYDQNELRVWIDSTLGESSVAAAPGIFYVFRDPTLKYEYLSSRVRRVSPAQPRQRISDRVFDLHRPLFESIMNFVSMQGRLPVPSELPEAEEIATKLGSIRRAFLIVKRVTDPQQWEQIRTDRAQDLLVYMALARFSRRPKFSALPTSLRLDIHAFFSNYSRACELADALLFSVRDNQLLEKACRASKIGKSTPTSLYVHRTAVDSLDPVLRVYEGCARALTGTVEGANVIKLHMHDPLVSYLSYPTFDTDAHPSLRSSLIANLRTFEIKRRDYSESGNPPILHRKEEFLSLDDEHRQTYHNLTLQEEQYGLYDQPAEIGLRLGWENLLTSKRLQIRGHELRILDSSESNAEDLRSL